MRWGIPIGGSISKQNFRLCFSQFTISLRKFSQHWTVFWILSFTQYAIEVFARQQKKPPADFGVVLWTGSLDYRKDRNRKAILATKHQQKYMEEVLIINLCGSPEDKKRGCVWNDLQVRACSVKFLQLVALPFRFYEDTLLGTQLTIKPTKPFETI